MLGVSKRWQATDDVWWLALGLDVSLLSDPGVYFVTTNNTYVSCLKRGPGVEALRELFADSVEWGRQGSRLVRYPGMPDSWTTDPQAEVLYPGRVPIAKLTAIYVPEEEHADHVRTWFPFYPEVPRVPVLVKPEVFRWS
jgi:hypothetical protein